MQVIAIDAPVPKTCDGCIFNGAFCLAEGEFYCTSNVREDGRDVIFVEHEDRDAARYRWIMAHCNVLLQNGKAIEDEAQLDALMGEQS